MKHSTVVFRHFETVKNTLDIHGRSDLSQLTVAGEAQLKRAAVEMQSKSFVRAVTCFPTPQAEHSARLLAVELQLPFEGPLTLSAFNLGVADGISTAELQRRAPASAQSLSLFRERVIDASRLIIERSETAQELENRLLKWWYTEGQTATSDRIVVGSSSTVLMLNNLFEGTLPTSGHYLCVHMPNGSYKVWNRIHPAGRREIASVAASWPDVQSRRIPTDRGFIQTSIHAAAWGQKQGVCVIAPGYFGNSRQGPYGLYSRIARELAKQGYETHTIDYLGSGESTPISRTFDSDVCSLMQVAATLHEEKLVLLGHSMGAAVVASVLSRIPDSIGLGVAPMVTLGSMRQALLSVSELDQLEGTGRVVRRGIAIDGDSLHRADIAWEKFNNLLSIVIAPSNDTYDPARFDLTGISADRLNFVNATDHNFSTGDGAAQLISILVKFLENWKLNGAHGGRIERAA